MASSQLFINSLIRDETSGHNPYLDFFMQPHGSGGGGVESGGQFENRIGSIYRQNPYYQRGYGHIGFQRHKSGRGLNSALASLWRFAFPIIKKGAQTLGSAAADVAANVASDVIEGKNFKDSAVEHMKSKGTELLREVPANIKGILQATSDDTQQQQPAETALAAPTPIRFRRVAKKRKNPPGSSKAKYPALKHFK